MALSSAQQWANAFGAKVNPTSFLDRFAHDVGNTAKGFVPGLLETGKTISHDVAAPFSGSDYRLDNLIGGMVTGFKDQSFIPALATGQFGEAWDRFNARPFSGLLDATLVAPAFKAATWTGARVGSTASREAFAGLGGYHQLTTGSAEAVRGALSSIADGDASRMFGSLPSTLDFEGGITKPTREFFGASIPQSNLIGDNLWLRPTARTIRPGKRRDSKLSKLHADQIDEPIGPDGDRLALDDDVSQTLLTPRADNEIWARFGDWTGQKFADAFPGYMSWRWGRRMARAGTRPGIQFSDQISYESGKNWSEVEQNILSQYPDLTPEQVREAVGLGGFIDSHGLSIDDMRGVADYFSPIRPEPGPIDDELLDLTQIEFMKKTGTGFLPYSQEGGYSNPVSGPDSHLTVRQLLDKYGDDLPNNYAYEAMSPALRDAFQRQHDARVDLGLHVDQSILNRTAVGNGWSYLDDDGVSQPLTMDQMQTPGIIDRIDFSRRGPWTEIDRLGNDMDAIQSAMNKLGNERMTLRQIRELDDPLINQILELRKDHFLRNKNVGRANRALYFLRNELDRLQGLRLYHEQANLGKKADTLNESTRAPLDVREIMRGHIALGNDFIAPGIVDRINEFVDPESELGQRVRQVMETEGYQKWLAFKDYLTSQGRDIEMERLDSNLLDSRAVNRAENRFPEWSGSDAVGKYHPVRYQRREQGESVVVNSDGELRNSVEASEPGNPYKVYVSGNIDTDPSIHTRNLQRQNDMLTQDRLLDNVKRLAVKFTDDDRSKYRGEFVDEGDLKKGGRKAPYVVLNRDGALSSTIRDLYVSLQEMSEAFHGQGGPDLNGVKAQLDEINILNDGDNIALPTEAYLAIKKEIGTSIKAVNAFYNAYRTVGDWWKFSVLHMRFPSWFRNNWIGAQLMLMMSGGPHRFFDAYGKTMSLMDDSNHEFMREAFRHEATELGSTHIARGLELDRMLGSSNKFAESRNKIKKFFNQLSDINAEYADSPARLARTQQIFDDRVAQLQQLARQNGMEIEDTPELRQQMVEHEPTRQGIAQEMLRDMVDFSDLSKFEKEWVIALFPFYSWMKGSGRALMRLEADHPQSLWAMEQVADIGERESIADAGQAAPDFARSWFNPFGDQWISTGGWNPYESPLDLMTMSLGWVPGGMSYRQYGSENLLGNMNPVLQGGTAALLGKDPFFGTPIPNDNPMDTFLQMQMKNPIISTLQIPWQKQGPTSTTNKSIPGSLANLMGVPVIDPRWGMVWSRGVDEAQERYKNSGTIGQLNPRAVGIS